jgi:hypothetical protein
MIDKCVDLDDSEKVREYLAKKEGINSYVKGLVDSYNRYARYDEITLSKPLIKRLSQPHYVPTGEEITILTCDTGKKYSLILSILRDC